MFLAKNAISPSIKTIEIDRLTDHNIWLQGERIKRPENLFHTFDEAQDYLNHQLKVELTKIRQEMNVIEYHIDVVNHIDVDKIKKVYWL